MGNMFSETAKASTTESGKQVVADCQEIVKSYISTNTTNGSLYDKLLQVSASSGDTYSTVANVSTYATLIAIGLNLKTTDEIALAGMLHDVGLAKVPPEIIKKTPDQRTKDEQHIYEKHPEYSIDIVKERKLVVSELVHKIILQHHEKFNGAGYPKNLSGTKICIEAQILQFADTFNEMTLIRAGETRKTPDDVLEYFRNTLRNPHLSAIDPELLKKILAIFPASNKKAAA
jgi:HD-GYP domain-containing protein (c-di-GMP phosphodiesterase class II)